VNFKNKKPLLIILICLIPLIAFAARRGREDYDLMMSLGNQGLYGTPWYLSRMAQHIFFAVFGAITGAFFSQKLRKFRKAAFVILAVLGAFIAVIMSVFIGNLIFFILAAVAAYYLLREAAVWKKPPKPTTFGSAEWADIEHLQKNNLIGKEGFMLGFFTNNQERYPIHYTGDRHLLTVAPTRSGKGVSSIIPNLLTYEGSVIIIDPKGENAMITAKRRGKGDPALGIPGMGQAVHIVDPWNITSGITGLPVSRFNPLDWLDPEDEDINENAMMLADSIIAPRAGSRDEFWDEEAKALLMGILLYVATDEEEKNNRNLGRVRDIICMGTSDLNEILRQMQSNENPIVNSSAERTISKDDKLRSNVIASLQSHTHFLDSPRIRKNLEKSDFMFEDLKTSKMSVYLVLPADRMETFGRWLRLLVQQALTVNARNIAAKPEKPVLFLLDEMSSLGRLTMVEQAYSLMAGFGIQLWGIVQDLSQLERIYNNGWETFIGNSGVLQYFGSRDNKTSGYFSKLCGVTTIRKLSFSRAIAEAISYSHSQKDSSHGGSHTTTDTHNYDHIQRPLAFPDELMVMRENKELVLVENFNPILGEKVLWYNDESLKGLGFNMKGPAVEAPQPPFKDLSCVAEQ
jgi:type IV secretion system protein VirD4